MESDSTTRFLDGSNRARLKRNDEGVAQAHDQDRAARELGETDTDARRLERDLAILAIVAGRRGRLLKGRRRVERVARLEATPSPTTNQMKSLGSFSERQRIQRLKPRNKFRGPGAFASMRPQDAFAATRLPPNGTKENVFRGLAVVDLVIQDSLTKGGARVLRNAMRRSGLPDGQEVITFRWGKPGEGNDMVNLSTKQREPVGVDFGPGKLDRFPCRHHRRLRP